MKNQNDGKQNDQKTAPQSGQPGRSDQSQDARAQQKKFESTSEAGATGQGGQGGQGATGPNSGKSANSSAPTRGNSANIDDQKSPGRADRDAKGGSSDEDTMTGKNPTDPSMVEATGEAKGDEGQETGGTGKSGYGKR